MNEIELDAKYVFQTYKRFPVVLTRGKGVRVWDSSGKEYLDCVAGVATVSLGHAHPAVLKALKEQSKKVMHVSNYFYNENQPKLAEKLCALSGLGRAFFCNSGAEAVEGAIKLARKYTGKKEIIAMKGSFHGRTLGALSLTWPEKYRAPFEPLLPGVKFVEYGNVEAVRAAINGNTAAVIVEPVQGEAGVRIPPKNYLKDLRTLCDEKGILLILDEVQIGLCRSGKFFAFQSEEILPDVLCLAKALGNGFPIGALLAKENVANSLAQGEHASTFGGNPLACAVALAVLEVMEKKKLAERAGRLGEYFVKQLRKIQNKKIKEVRGKGLLIGVELTEEARPVCEKLLEKGVLSIPTGNTVRFAPPLIIKRKEIDSVGNALSEVLAGA